MRILVEFMKNEVECGEGMKYEPLLSQLISLKDKYLI